MKALKFLTAAAVAFSVVSCGNKTTYPKEVQDIAPTKAEIDSISYLVGVNFGMSIKNNRFDEVNLDMLIKGMKDVVAIKGDVNKEENLSSLKIQPSELQRLYPAFMEKKQEVQAKLNTKKETEFLETVSKKEGIIKTDSGVYMLVHNAGAETKITMEDTLFVHYKGSLPDGTVFDECPADKPSVRFTLGGVIKGWQDALVKVGSGASVTVYIPSELAYGKNGQPMAGIEPCTPLVFDITVDSLRVKKASVK